ncbi:NAD(P)/FAD-dependent oxidoreductase, partial [Nguyenibacter vanlangensis]
FGPNRPPLAGLEGFEASGAVQYYVRRRAEFAGTRIVIAGGGDSAIDWALSLQDVAEKIWLVHRRDRFRAAPESLRQLDAAVAAGRIEKVVPYQLHGLQGVDGELDGVEVATLDGERRLLPGNRLLPFFGLSTDLGPIAQWGIDSIRSTIPVVPSSCETSLPGVFAVGDVAAYPGKLKLILQGFSEGAMAAHAIHPIVRPDTALHFEYSTSKGVPHRT